MLDAAEKTKAGKRDLSGVAYGRAPQQSDKLLTQVGPGTPTGEYLRRYWHPIATSEQVTNRPRKVKLLGEELIIFRNGKGQVGLLYPRCMHRGTSLYYGRVEEVGIRCCYHGWLFDTQGNCLEQPCEPQGGLRRDAARQPWYPTEERYGIVFAYLGPADRMPVLPRYDILEELEEGEFLQVWGGDGAIAYVDTKVDAEVAPYNWLQAYENVMDPWHTWILHATFSVSHSYEGNAIKPKIDFERHGLGTVYHAVRDLDDGRTIVRTNYAILPNVAAISPVALRGDADFIEGRGNTITWYVAADDESFKIYNVFKTRKQIPGFAHLMTPDGRSWSQMTEEEHRDYPGDFEAQWGQGTISLHSEEHLAQSDVGVVTLRRVMKEQIKAVENGGDPLGVRFDESEATVEVISGNFYRKP
jgi:phenylpropionate dioxygenase-like ring-hydroxylating dioxygenase large terminal subunit